MNTTTITLDKKTKRLLDKRKLHSREPYDDVVIRILNHESGYDIDETAAILSDPEIMAGLARSVKDLAAGRVYDVDGV